MTLFATPRRKFLVGTSAVLGLAALGLKPALAQAKNYGQGVFELRTYTTEPGRLEALNARFRDHTLKLFEKHGMTNVSYWNLAADQKGAKSPLVAGNTLIYLLTHKSEDAAKASFDAFQIGRAHV